MTPGSVWMILACMLPFLLQGCVSSAPVTKKSAVSAAAAPDKVVIRLIRTPPPQKPQNQMVLLPNSEVKTGQILVRTAAGVQTISGPYEATHIRNTNTLPAPPAPMPLEEVQRIFGAALSALPDKSLHILLYFQKGAMELLPKSAALIPHIVDLIAQRHSTDIGINGHADRVGAPEHNLELSQKRAEAVRGLLSAKGIPAENMDISFFGDKKPLTPEPRGKPEPRNRCVEVIVR